jgi:hypothetical protein
MQKAMAPFGYILAVIAGIPPAFFLVFNAIFSDGGSVPERIFSFFLVIMAYGILGLVFGLVRPRPSWRWGLWIGLPAFIIVVWYSYLEADRLLLHFLYLVAAFTPACLAGLAGARLSARRKKEN